MKKYLFVFFLLFIPFAFAAFATEPFRFALFTDTHISATNPQPSEDLRNAVKDINAMNGIDFVLVSGDVSDLGDIVSLKEAKLLLDKLRMPYYILPGNHDIRWSEPQATNFATIFGADKFAFIHKGYQFIGFATAPLAKPGNGIIQKKDIDWMKVVLEKVGNGMPVFAVTHYPLQKGDVDNWKEATDILKEYNILTVLGGHCHRNVLFNYDGIPGIICRSALRAKNAVGGYSIFSVSDSIKVSEKRIGTQEELWLALPLELKQ